MPVCGIPLTLERYLAVLIDPEVGEHAESMVGVFPDLDLVVP